MRGFTEHIDTDEQMRFVNRVLLTSRFYRNSVNPWNYRQRNKYRANRRDGRSNGSLDYHGEPELVEAARATTFPPWKITVSGEHKPPGRPSAIFHLRLHPPFAHSLAFLPFLASSGSFRKAILPTEDLSSPLSPPILSFGIISQRFHSRRSIRAFLM